MTRIDRRALFTSGAAAALLAATGTSLSAAPRTGGTLRLAVPRDGGLLEQVARGAIYDGLTEIAPDGVLRGELARAWVSSEDAKSWTFDLRRDVRFHDGSLLTGEDVVASLEAQDVPGGLKAAEMIEAGRVRLELNHGNRDLPYQLSDPTLVIAPGGKVDAPLTEAVGTGCYRVSDVQGDRHFRADKVKNHYRAGRAGWADQVEIIVIPDAGVRAEALRDGYVDVAVLPQPEGLLNQGDFQFHPSARELKIAAHRGVGLPRMISARGLVDDSRIAERWWMG